MIKFDSWEDRWETFLHCCEDENVKLPSALTDFVARDFMDAPASSSHHGAYAGGLFDHSFNVYKHLRDMTVNNHLTWQRPESPFIVGMFHDLCKVDQYVKEETAYKYNDHVLLKGHGEKSVMLLSTFITLTEEEMLCIRYHMGAYKTDEWEQFGMAIKKYPNVLWTHMADMLASQVDDI